jgi:hypothetical protein
MWAVDDVDKARLLLDAGAEVDAHSTEGRTALSRQLHAKMGAYNYFATADIRLLQSVCYQRALRLSLAVTILSFDMFAFNGRA